MMRSSIAKLGLVLVPVALAWAVPAQAAQSGESAVHDCDRLAASPTDDTRIADPVDDVRLQPRLAIPACRAAVHAYPDEPRYWFQLGRALNLAGSEGENAEAVYWLNKAHEEGHVDAAAWLASILIDGEAGVEADVFTALDLFYEAANKKNNFALAGLADAYFNGTGVALDRDEALVWYRTAAENNDAFSMMELGRLHEEGVFVSADLPEALHWYRKAAAGGNPIAMYKAASILAFQTLSDDNGEAAGYMFDAIAFGYRAALQEMTENSSRWPDSFRRALQAKLQTNGAYEAGIDGVFGPATRRGLEKVFNKSSGASESGRVAATAQ
jgi:tetratricopeptide (TPR) repeat protein